MASSCIVPVVKLENVRKHPNADKLDLADVLGYQVAIAKDKHKSGDVVIYFPADTIISSKWAEKFGVRDFLRGKDKDRVGKIKLRGEPSFGLVVDVPDELDCNVGDNVAEYFEAKKYEPPINPHQADMAKYDSDIDPYFQKYTDIENGLIYIDVFKQGEEIVANEKIHGSNCRVGCVHENIVAGSHTTRRKYPQVDGVDCSVDDEQIRRSIYWYPWSIESVRNMISDLSKEFIEIILYGEVYGRSIQSLDYGIPKGQGLGFRAFDLLLNDKYVDYDRFCSLCDQYGVERVPEIYRGPFDINKIKEIADGNSLISEANHIREGVVVKPVKERTDPKIGRAILKYIGTEYSLSKKSDYKDV